MTMTEIDALLKIADAINSLAVAVGVMAIVEWLTLLVKTQNSNESINRVARVEANWSI